jgi:hypothetical protein
MNKSPNGGCHFCKDPENLMHLFVNCKLVDSVWTEIFQKINEFYEQNEIQLSSVCVLHSIGIIGKMQLD